MPKDKNANAAELIGSPDKLINQLIKGAENREWAVQAITLEGPPHKQIQHTLVLSRLAKLIAMNKKNGGKSLQFYKGEPIIVESPEGGTELPISLPEKSLQSLKEIGEVTDKLLKGPLHEVLYTAVLLQVIEAMIEAEENKNAE